MEKVKCEFKVGDRVQCVKADVRHQTQSHNIGLIGTVIIISTLNNEPDHLYSVEHDEYKDFLHTCRGACENGYGWNYFGWELELVEDGMVAVTVDDLI